MVTKEEYAPYHTMHAFEIGIAYAKIGIAYANGNSGPYHYSDVEKQAFDRGAEFAMRLEFEKEQRDRT